MRDNDVSKVVWCMFFAGNVSMAMFHPGNRERSWPSKESGKACLDMCGKIADSMYDEYSRRFESFKE